MKIKLEQHNQEFLDGFEEKDRNKIVNVGVSYAISSIIVTFVLKFMAWFLLISWNWKVALAIFVIMNGREVVDWILRTIWVDPTVDPILERRDRRK